MLLQGSALVVVIDDEEPVRQAVSRTLATNGYVVEAFGSGRAYLDARRWFEPDCLLSDILMPQLDGVALCRAARRAGLEVPTVFMTASSDAATIVAAMKCGAIDLLLKPFTADALLSAVATAVRHGRSHRDERAHLLELWARARTLTPREAEVAALVGSGRLNKQVAAVIGTREKTVKVHRARAMQKLGVRSVAELVRALDELLAARRERVVLADVAHSAPQSVAVMARALAGVSGQTTGLDSSPDTTKGQYLRPPTYL